MSASYPDFAPAAGPWSGPEPAYVLAATDVPAGRRGVIGSIVAFALVVIGVAASGLLLGRIWAEVAPRVAVTKVAAGFVYADSEPEQAVAADGWFAILGVAAGVLFAVLAWVLLRRHRGIAVMVGLALGCLAAACLAWWVGHSIGLAEFSQVRDAAAVGDRIDAPLDLRMTNLDADSWWVPRPTGVAAVQALAAVFVYTCLAGFSSYANLRPPDPRPYPEWTPYGAVQRGPDAVQFGPGPTGSSDSGTGTART